MRRYLTSLVAFVVLEELYAGRTIILHRHIVCAHVESAFDVCARAGSKQNLQAFDVIVHRSEVARRVATLTSER